MAPLRINPLLYIIFSGMLTTSVLQIIMATADTAEIRLPLFITQIHAGTLVLYGSGRSLQPFQTPNNATTIRS